MPCSGDRGANGSSGKCSLTEVVVGVDLLLSRSEHEWPANRRNWRSGIYAHLYKGICIYVFLSYICVLLI